MKKIILLLSLIALFCQSANAQTGGLNFQGVARNSTGAVLANQKINLKFSILKTTETGAVEYTETKEVTTNAQGIFAVVVGEVNATSFAAVDWKASPKFLKVEMDPAGGTSFASMGTTRLQNVPYAYYANGVNANNIDGTISVAKGGTGATDAAAARTNLGLVIGTNVQAPLTAGADYLTPSGSAASLTNFPTLNQNTTGNAATATKLATAKNINGVSFDGSADITISVDANTLSGTVPIAKGGTGATTAADARANLGLVIGTNVQAPLTAGTDYLRPTGSAASLTNFPTLNQNTTGNASTATKLSTARNINGVAFDGSANITVAADAGTLSGTVSIAKGGTGLTTAGTAGQVLTSTGSGTFTWTSSGVPYSGATGAVNLGAYDLTVNGLNIGRGNGNIDSNTANGKEALAANTTGYNNTASGALALYSNTTGSFNTANGAYALYSNTTGSVNIANGANSLSYNTTGSSNITSGVDALRYNTTGNYNTAIGRQALFNNSSGSNNTAIGYSANVGSGNLTNATALGNGAIVASSNTIQLGNTDVTSVKTSGALTTGSVTYPNIHGSNGQVLTTSGSGTLTWSTLAGLPTTGNTGGDMLYWNGSAWVKVAAGSDGQTLTFYNGAPIWLGANTVVSRTGRIWMDRNLGASQVATSSYDEASFGYLYQWGRGSDGHQIRTSSTTATLSSSDQPGVSNFITTNGEDWRSPQNANLWQGVSGVNNPCPTGFRIPTDTEWEAERLSWGVSSSAGALASPLKLPMAGNRVSSNGALNAIGLWGEYWSSTVNGNRARILFISSGFATMDSLPRSIGVSVRCIKD